MTHAPVAPHEIERLDPLPAIRVEGVRKAFGAGSKAVVALEGVFLDVAPHEFVCVVGASGCGKSTLLNLLAGLDEPTAGRIAVGGGTALMFQDAALFPWLTVAAMSSSRCGCGAYPEGSDVSEPRSCCRPCSSTASVANAPISCPAGCVSVWRSHGPSPRTRTSC